MSETFFIGDLHLGHEKIIDYETRPFKNVDEMDKVIIKCWNTVVKQDDKIFILGDLTFYPKEKSKEIIKQLNGRKILIIGSHDHNHSVSWFKEVGINEIYKYPIIYKKFYILSHEPVYLNNHMPYCNIHAHTHHQKMNSIQYFNAAVECLNYTPISFKEIQNFYQNLQK